MRIAVFISQRLSQHHEAAAFPVNSRTPTGGVSQASQEGQVFGHYWGMELRIPPWQVNALRRYRNRIIGQW